MENAQPWMFYCSIELLRLIESHITKYDQLLAAALWKEVGRPISCHGTPETELGGTRPPKGEA
ncbi:hypothetical protein OUZ56_012328 [Daphnia magna]|uniref:Uncharacterized protein n=1 Tax=Daphnia magna TaxID=35525 RepID=A0ABQ9Z2U1_9CRUS|nr:hypothetical protein OUZ56_012328 [Daphnia magna]